MSFARIVSLFCAGAFFAFALVYYGLVSDPGAGAYYALAVIALVWIVALSEDRRTSGEDSKRIR